MTLLMEWAVGKKKTETGKESPSKKHSWDQRKGLFVGIAAYRDVGEWAADIAAFATRDLKRRGQIKGRQQVSIARVIDPFLRGVLWNALWALRHAQAGTPKAPIPPCPAPPEPPLELGLPE